ncbi:MAG: peroxidase-related enzyme [Chlorobi bacterium]|nr:peroxidase-related enzyme [Chlorobiota bacterium]
MAFIPMIHEEEAQGDLRFLYGQIAGNRGGVADVLKIHSLLPETMQAHFDLYKTIMFGLRRTGLSRRLLEMIGVVVSSCNECRYCVEHHSQPLRAMGLTERTIEALRHCRWEDMGELPVKERLVLRHAVKITREPASISATDIEELREAGYSDEQILHLTLVASYFNFVNRNVMALGVQLEEGFEKTCR